MFQTSFTLLAPPFSLLTKSLSKKSLCTISMSQEGHIDRAWAHWEKLGQPKLIVAPMVDQSELPFRMLCRKYGATAAYTPMLHSRLFSDCEKYRKVEFTTCQFFEGTFRGVWAYWEKLGRAKLVVASMVDQSELPFRMLCRKYGVTAAYTPMLHSRLFSECEKYRKVEFTTCQEDRPLFVQFCANDPDTLLEAAKKVEDYCDYVDINLGCPQRIAKRGNYGAFLMDNLPLIKSLVEKLALNLSTPVSCKIRIFPELQDTLDYAKMLEDAGCSLLAVHGRTRDEKDQRKVRANLDAIKAVKNYLKIPVLANGNVRHMDDVYSCLEETGADGVLSAEALLENPALFAGFRTAEWVSNGEENSKDGQLDQADLLVEYLQLCEKYPVPWRMVRSHVHKLLGEWFRAHPEVREEFNSQSKLTFEFLYGMVDSLRELGARIPLYVEDPDVEKISENGIGR